MVLKRGGYLEDASIFLLSTGVWLSQLWDMEFLLCLSSQAIYATDRCNTLFLPSALSVSLVPSEPKLSAMVASMRTSHRRHGSLKCRNHQLAEILLLLSEVPKYFSSEENMAKYMQMGCH